MRRILGLALITVAVLASPAAAPILFLLQDDFDDRQLVSSFAKDSVAQRERVYLDSLKDQLGMLRKTQVESILGEGVGKLPERTFAMPVCQPRFVGMTGLHKTGEIHHAEFYIVEDVGAFEVHYGWGNGPPAILVTYLMVDKDFIRLTSETMASAYLKAGEDPAQRMNAILQARIQWDNTRLQVLHERVDSLVRQWRAVRG